MTELHLFGASTHTGKSLINKLNNNNSFKLIPYSKSNSYSNIDFNDPSSFQINSSKSSLWVSLAPIWLFANFFNHLCKNNNSALNNLKGIIVCSSTSIITKKFAFNSFDKNLYSNLLLGEGIIISNSERKKIPLVIIRPTMIYGNLEESQDKNLSKIIKIMNISPILPIPSNSGLRQPIHTSQLSESILTLIKKFSDQKISTKKEIINLGGDYEISYFEMIKSIKESLPSGSSAKNCKIIEIPDLLFKFFSILIFFISTKFFEAVLRIKADLSGFEKSYLFNKSKPKPFPIKELH